MARGGLVAGEFGSAELNEMMTTAQAGQLPISARRSRAFKQADAQTAHRKARRFSAVRSGRMPAHRTSGSSSPTINGPIPYTAYNRGNKRFL